MSGYHHSPDTRARTCAPLVTIEILQQAEHFREPDLDKGENKKRIYHVARKRNSVRISIQHVGVTPQSNDTL